MQVTIARCRPVLVWEAAIAFDGRRGVSGSRWRVLKRLGPVPIVPPPQKLTAISQGSDGSAVLRRQIPAEACADVVSIAQPCFDALIMHGIALVLRICDSARLLASFVTLITGNGCSDVRGQPGLSGKARAKMSTTATMLALVAPLLLASGASGLMLPYINNRNCWAARPG